MNDERYTILSCSIFFSNSLKSSNLEINYSEIRNISSNCRRYLCLDLGEQGLIRRKEEEKGKNYHLEITVFPSHPPFFDYFSLLTDGGRPQPLCLTLPPDAHADFATLYVICEHCNLLSVRIERASRL